jgi:hypothetical protein
MKRLGKKDHRVSIERGGDLRRDDQTVYGAGATAVLLIRTLVVGPGRSDAPSGTAAIPAQKQSSGAPVEDRQVFRKSLRGRSGRYISTVTCVGFEALEPEGPAWHLACDGRRFLLLGVVEHSHAPSDYCAVAEFSLDLLVDDLAEAKARFEAADVQFVSEFEPTADRSFIRDPDGLVLEIIQATDDDGSTGCS